ncbi:MAG: DUF3828 domain-containing protein [Muribaculaceae bacterium]|nr:DUF3828 domain-containing protein [Muribaculaceae bacterium]
MKKLLFCFFALILALGSCQAKSSKDAVVPDKTVANIGSESDELVNRVRDIYATVFSGYLRADSLRNIGQYEVFPTPESLDALNAKFLTPELNGLFRQVNEIDSKYHSDEIGFFDADYWIMGQDWDSNLHVSDVKVQEINGDEAWVRLLVHNFDNATPLLLQMHRCDGIWLIDSFVDPDGFFDMKMDLQEYIVNETKKKY